MSRLSERIGALEAKYGEPTGPRRVYAVCGGPVDGSPEDYIRSWGLEVDDRDLIIHSGMPWGWVGTPPVGAMQPTP
jgi:hypothetical protein